MAFLQRALTKYKPATLAVSVEEREKAKAAPHIGGVWERMVKAARKQCMLGKRSIKNDFLSTTMCIVEQTRNAKSLTPVSSDFNDLEALTPNQFLFGNKNVCLPFLPCAEKFVDYRKLFQQTQAYANLIWDRFCQECLPTWNYRKNGDLRLTKPLTKAVLFG